MLVGMTVWELSSPTVLRKGFLPIATTRGDRLFIGLLAAAYLNLAFVGVSEQMVVWFGLEQEPSIWISFVVSMLAARRWSCARADALFGKAPGPSFPAGASI